MQKVFVQQCDQTVGITHHHLCVFVQRPRTTPSQHRQPSASTDDYDGVVEVHTMITAQMGLEPKWLRHDQAEREREAE